MTYANHGLGDFGSLGDSIADDIAAGFVLDGVKTAPGSLESAKALWRNYVGAPYTGNAGDPQTLAAAIRLAVRIANKDTGAAIEALRSADPALQALGKRALVSLPSLLAGVPYSQLQDLYRAGRLTAGELQSLTGINPAAMDRAKVIERVLAAGFLPGVGGWARVRNDGIVEYLNYGWDAKYNQVKGAEWTPYSTTSVFDALDGFDYAGLRQAVLASYANSVKGQQIAPAAVTPTAVIPTIKSDIPAVDANAPPSGWHAGSMNGKNGWWGPDGLFYAGATPWTSYVPGTGKSITPPPPPVVVAPLVPGSGTGHDGDAGPPAPHEPPPVASAPPTPVGPPAVPAMRITDTAPTDGYIPTPPLVQPVATGMPAEAGVGGSGLLIGLGIAGAAAYFLFGRKH